MRILSVSHYYGAHLGGIPVIAGNLNEQFSKLGHEVIWAASQFGGDLETRDRPIELTPLSAWNGTERLFGFPFPIVTPRSLGRLRAIAREVDVVHVHDCLYASNIWATRAALHLHRPVVVTQHIGYIPYENVALRLLMSAANRTLGRWTLAAADRVVFYSRAVQAYFSDFVAFRGSPLFIANGVDEGLFYPAASDSERVSYREELGLHSERRIVLFVGRFVEKKGVSRVRTLCLQFPDVDFVFVGDGPIDPRGWGQANVFVYDRQCQGKLRRFYASADLLLLPSRGEGFPLVVQEAMACGLPCLVSSETGWWYTEARDYLHLTELDSASIAANLREALRSTGELDAFRGKVASFARATWNWERASRQYLSLFEQLRAGCPR